MERAADLSSLNPETTVFHLAAMRWRPGVSAELYQRLNVVGTMWLAERAREADVAKFVHVSTAVSFGPSEERPRCEADGYNRTTHRNPYVHSRIESAIGMKDLQAKGLRLVVVSPAIIFGPDQRDHPNRITDHVRRILRWPADIFFDGGNQKRNLVYVGDVVRGITLAEQGAQCGEEFILGGEDVSPRELSSTVRRLANRPAKARFSIPPRVANRVARGLDGLMGRGAGNGAQESLWLLRREWRYTSHKAQTLLGYRPVTLENGLRQTLRFVLGAGRI